MSECSWLGGAEGRKEGFCAFTSVQHAVRVSCGKEGFGYCSPEEKGWGKGLELVLGRGRHGLSRSIYQIRRKKNQKKKPNKLEEISS